MRYQKMQSYSVFRVH